MGGGRAWKQCRHRGLSEAYRLTRGNLDKAQFRLDWTKTCYNTVVREKTERRQKSHTDIAKGMYEPFTVIVEKEGGKATRQWGGGCILERRSLGVACERGRTRRPMDPTLRGAAHAMNTCCR